MNDSWLNKVNWTQDGLVPAIAQEAGSGRVLMVAWMNREALGKTAQTGEAHGYLRVLAVAFIVLALVLVMGGAR